LNCKKAKQQQSVGDVGSMDGRAIYPLYINHSTSVENRYFLKTWIAPEISNII
jgi:hypothetical protein